MKEFFAGAARALGIVAGFMPTAVSFGAIALQGGVPPGATAAMSVWIFAGASQFAAVEAVRQGLPWLSIVLTVLVVNLRHVPMSLSIVSQIYSRFPRWQQWILCHGIVDETFAMEMSEPPRPFSYYLGMHLACWFSWIGGTVVGALVGLQIPERWLTFALPGLFIYLLVNAMRQVADRKIWIVLAAGIALTQITLTLKATGILLSIAGIAVLATLLLNSETKVRKDS